MKSAEKQRLETLRSQVLLFAIEFAGNHTNMQARDVVETAEAFFAFVRGPNGASPLSADQGQHTPEAARVYTDAMVQLADAIERSAEQSVPTPVKPARAAPQRKTINRDQRSEWTPERRKTHAIAVSEGMRKKRERQRLLREAGKIV